MPLAGQLGRGVHEALLEEPQALPDLVVDGRADRADVVGQPQDRRLLGDRARDVAAAGGRRGTARRARSAARRGAAGSAGRCGAQPRSDVPSAPARGGRRRARRGGSRSRRRRRRAGARRRRRCSRAAACRRRAAGGGAGDAPARRGSRGAARGRARGRAASGRRAPAPRWPTRVRPTAATVPARRAAAASATARSTIDVTWPPASSAIAVRSAPASSVTSRSSSSWRAVLMRSRVPDARGVRPAAIMPPCRSTSCSCRKTTSSTRVAPTCPP